MDTGPILATAETAIGPEEDAGSLGARLAELGGPLLVETLGALDAGRIEPRSQDHTAATYAPKLLPEERTIDWSQPADAVVRKVRAFAPDPGAVTTFRRGTAEGDRRTMASRPGGWMLADAPAPGAVLTGTATLGARHGRVVVELLEVAPAGRRADVGRGMGAGRADRPGRASRMSPSARQVALEVIRRVADEGAYSNRLLPAALGRSGLDERDRALATELAYGTLRHVPELDAAIGARAARPIARMTPGARAALRLGAYQLVAHPDPGACGGRRDRRRRGAARTRVRERDPPPAGEGAVRLLLKVTTSTRSAFGPGWRRGRWRSSASSCPPDEVERAALALGEHGPLTLRVNTCRATVDQVVARLREGALEPEVGPIHPECVLLPGGNPTSLPGWDEGWFTVQDQASAFVVGDARSRARRPRARRMRVAGREDGVHRLSDRRGRPCRRR